MKIRLTSLFATLALALAFAAPAMAQTSSPNADAYVLGQEQTGGGGGDVAGVQKQSPAPAAAVQETADTGNTLPFTGAELGIFALIGGLLLGTGLVMRRAAGSNDHA